MITKMFESSIKRVNSEVNKVKEAAKAEGLTQFKDNLSQMLDDKVRVDEVQDALKRITENFNFKIDQLQDQFCSKQNEGAMQNKETLSTLCV